MNNKQRNELKKKELEFGNEIFELIKNLYPICRSITGDGIKKTLKIIKKEFPKLKIYKIL